MYRCPYRRHSGQYVFRLRRLHPPRRLASRRCFYAEYAFRNNRPQDYADVINQFITCARHTYDPKNGLYRHACVSSNLINRAKEELATQVAEARKVRFLTKEQVKELCGVCDATLWHWNRKGYLKAVKIGNKIRYRTSDIQRILGERECK